MSSTASDSQEDHFPVTVTATAAMPRLASSAPLSDIYLTEFDDSLSALQTHPTTQCEANTLSERDEMNTTWFRPRRVASGSSSGGTVYVSPTEHELQDEPHEFPHFREVASDEDPHNDAYNSDEFSDDEGPTTAQKAQKPIAAKKKRFSSSQQSKATSSASASAKRHRKAQDHEQNTSPMLSSSPRSEKIRVKRPRLQDIEDGDADAVTPEPVNYESIEEATKQDPTPASGRTLRKKTIQQTHPYQFERIQYNLEKATGVAANSEDIEEMIDSTPKQKPKARRSSGRRPGGNKADKANKKSKSKREQTGEPKRGRSDSLISVTSSVRPIDVLEKTTIQIWLDGFPHGAAPVGLSKVENIDQLIDRMIDNWDWKFEGKVFSHAIASFPWLSKESNILIRPGMTDSFLKLVGEVKTAPTWTETAEDKEKSCEVKVTVFLQARK
ncbi:hypothetical protein LTR84_005267 [Exophiala bonariae]|uniref:Uncharacterized protein n=1 Tax=Exophiala bonariae TaxID=1690606 RepID=A0AAV9NPP8_9EURO|nr:hypothetical protein LTR84_005267 [Exophiala bonariae]